MPASMAAGESVAAVPAPWEVEGVEVLEELDYRDESDDPADYKEELEQLRDLCLERDESASLLWK